MISKSTRRRSPTIVPRVLFSAIVVTTALIILLPILHHMRTHEASRSSSAVKQVGGGVLPPMKHLKVSVPPSCSLTYNLALVPVEASGTQTYVQSSSLNRYKLMVEIDATYNELTNSLCFIQGRADIFRIDHNGIPSITTGNVVVNLYSGLAEYSTVVDTKAGDARSFVMTDPFPVGGAVRVGATFVFDGTTHVINGPMSCVPAGMTNSTCEL